MSAPGSAAVRARQWPARTAGAFRRIGAVPATIRLVATLAALASAIIAAPPQVSPLTAGFGATAGLGALGVGLLPRTRWVTIFLMLVVGLWLLGTVGIDGGVTVLRAGLLAAAVYLTHAAAALAAVLPYDCVVTFRVLRAWVGRVLTVVVAGVGLGVVGLAAIGYLPTARSVVGPIVGSLIAAGLAGLLAWHLRRR